MAKEPVITPAILKKVLEETRDHLTDMPKGVLIYPMACDVLASGDQLLIFIAARLNKTIQDG